MKHSLIPVGPGLGGYTRFCDRDDSFGMVVEIKIPTIRLGKPSFVIGVNNWAIFAVLNLFLGCMPASL